MRSSIRYALAGMSGLALLSMNQWARGHIGAFGPVGKYLLGVLPNFAAALAMPLILASFLANDRDGTERPVTPRQFLMVAAFTSGGLIAWEFLQLAMAPFRFDGADVAATVLGTVVAWGLFRLLRPR